MWPFENQGDLRLEQKPPDSWHRGWGGVWGDPVPHSRKEGVKESFSSAFCQRLSALPATPISPSQGGLSCGQTALIQLSADLPLNPKALNQHPTHFILQAHTNRSLSKLLGEHSPPLPAIPLACAHRPALMTTLLLPYHHPFKGD